LALAISVPSISIVSVLVLQYDLLQTSTGQIVLSSVTVSDVVAFIILAGIVRSIERTEIIALEVGVFVVLFVLVDYLLNRRPRALKELIARASGIFRREDFAYAFLIIVGLTISVVFQAIGLTYILGAFFAGLIVHDGLIGRKPFQRVSDTLSTMNNVFFIPLFFGFAGLEVSLIGLNAIFYADLAVILILMMVVGVALTYYVSKRLLQAKHDLSPKQVAAISAGRGAIGIVIAAVALNEGVLHRTGYSLVLLSTLVISLVIPFITGRICRRPVKKRVEDLD
jgi:Kef-type K+ transport system membrane component KefB